MKENHDPRSPVRIDTLTREALSVDTIVCHTCKRTIVAGERYRRTLRADNTVDYEHDRHRHDWDPYF